MSTHERENLCGGLLGVRPRFLWAASWVEAADIRLSVQSSLRNIQRTQPSLSKNRKGGGLLIKILGGRSLSLEQPLDTLAYILMLPYFSPSVQMPFVLRQFSQSPSCKGAWLFCRTDYLICRAPCKWKCGAPCSKIRQTSRWWQHSIKLGSGLFWVQAVVHHPGPLISCT